MNCCVGTVSDALHAHCCCLDAGASEYGALGTQLPAAAASGCRPGLLVTPGSSSGGQQACELLLLSQAA
jgi:hypothetical protein